MGDILLVAFVFLCAGVVAVPTASRLGLGSVLGYLVAGILISPLLRAAAVDVIAIQHFAEFGVVMMLFLVGLELEPKRLWEMRNKLFGLGGLQVAGTALVVFIAALLLGQLWSVSLAIGIIFALSSTAIVLQTLNEKGLLQSDGGQSSFSVLLFQDIAVIPILALLPLLALPGAGHAVGHGGEDGHGGGLNLVADLPGWGQALVTLGAIALVMFVGIVLSRPLFRYIAMARLRELFTAAALTLIIGIALLMTLVGLSPALGTFLAGVVLANSEYRHELESDVEPFKGLLLGVFFITVGASVDFGLLSSNLGTILALTAAVMLAKALVLLVLSYIFKVSGAGRWLMVLGLAQAGEFGFVLLSFAVQSHVLPDAIADQLLLVVALSMLLTPALFVLFDKIIAPLYSSSQDQPADEVDVDHPIIVAGHGRWGGIVNRMLRSVGCETTVLDYSSTHLEMVRAFGFKVFFGDATRPDLLEAAGIAKARMLIVAIDEKHAITELTRYVCKTYPNVHVIARAVDRNHVYELWAAGCRDIIRETFDSGVRAGRCAFEALGTHPFEAERLARQFVRNDRAAMIDLASLYNPDIPIHENHEYVEKAKQIIAEREAEMRGDGREFSHRTDRGWSPPTLNDQKAVTEQDRVESFKSS